MLNVCFKLSLTLPADDTLRGIALVSRFIFFDVPVPSCVMKFLACNRHFVIATKSSPTAALEPLPGADPAILSIMLTTEPMSLTAALKDWRCVVRNCHTEHKGHESCKKKKGQEGKSSISI
uniref:Uncharacterized protein n=1 Tax=Oryza meridionalis TaxID=40149 RepID=A0A0E0EP66_9ORYZ